jgi:hypothetical protein
MALLPVPPARESVRRPDCSSSAARRLARRGGTPTGTISMTHHGLFSCWELHRHAHRPGPIGSTGRTSRGGRPGYTGQPGLPPDRPNPTAQRVGDGQMTLCELPCTSTVTATRRAIDLDESKAAQHAPGPAVRRGCGSPGTRGSPAGPPPASTGARTRRGGGSLERAAWTAHRPAVPSGPARGRCPWPGRPRPYCPAPP